MVPHTVKKEKKTCITEVILFTGQTERQAAQTESKSERSKRHKRALSASANRWMVAECYASVAARIDQMLSVSRQPAAFCNCQHSRRDILTLCLTSIHSFNTAEGHASMYRAHTHTHLLTNTHRYRLNNAGRHSGRDRGVRTDEEEWKHVRTDG